MRVNPVKFLGVFAVVSGGCYLAFVPYIFPRSIEAITNAPVAVVRASIDGRFGRAPISAGDMISQGKVVGAISNARANGTFLIEMQNDRALLAATVSAVDRQIALLRERREELSTLVAKSRENLIERLRSQLREQRIRVEGLKVDHKLLREEAGRQSQLAARQVTTSVKVDTANQTAAVARLKMEAEGERAVHLAWQVQAAENGLIFDLDGSITSARLRIDEIDEKLYVLTSERQSKYEKLTEVEGAVRREAQRIELLGKAALVAPISGRVWQVPPTDDEFVKEGEPLLEIVNCAAVVVTATVSERTFNRLDIGQPVEFVPENDGPRQTGMIIQAHGPASRVDASRFAIRPASSESKEFRIVAHLDGTGHGTEEGCRVGRTGKMFFQARYPAMIDQLVVKAGEWLRRDFAGRAVAAIFGARGGGEAASSAAPATALIPKTPIPKTPI